MILFNSLLLTIAFASFDLAIVMTIIEFFGGKESN